MQIDPEIELKNYRNAFVDNRIREALGNHYYVDTNIVLFTLGYREQKRNIRTTREETISWLTKAQITIPPPVIGELLHPKRKYLENILSFLYTQRVASHKKMSLGKIKKREEELRINFWEEVEKRKRNLKNMLDHCNIRFLLLKSRQLPKYFESKHQDRYEKMMEEVRTGPIDLNDAQFLLLSKEEGATVVSFDYGIHRVATIYKIPIADSWEQLPEEFTLEWKHYLSNKKSY